MGVKKKSQMCVNHADTLLTSFASRCKWTHIQYSSMFCKDKQWWWWCLWFIFVHWCKTLPIFCMAMEGYMQCQSEMKSHTFTLPSSCCFIPQSNILQGVILKPCGICIARYAYEYLTCVRCGVDVNAAVNLCIWIVFLLRNPICNRAFRAEPYSTNTIFSASLSVNTLMIPHAAVTAAGEIRRHVQYTGFLFWMFVLVVSFHFALMFPHVWIFTA